MADKISPARGAPRERGADWHRVLGCTGIQDGLIQHRSGLFGVVRPVQLSLRASLGLALPIAAGSSGPGGIRLQRKAVGGGRKGRAPWEYGRQIPRLVVSRERVDLAEGFAAVSGAEERDQSRPVARGNGLFHDRETRHIARQTGRRSEHNHPRPASPITQVLRDVRLVGQGVHPRSAGQLSLTPVLGTQRPDGSVGPVRPPPPRRVPDQPRLARARDDVSTA